MNHPITSLMLKSAVNREKKLLTSRVSFFSHVTLPPSFLSKTSDQSKTTVKDNSQRQQSIPTRDSQQCARQSQKKELDGVRVAVVVFERLELEALCSRGG